MLWQAYSHSGFPHDFKAMCAHSNQDPHTVVQFVLAVHMEGKLLLEFEELLHPLDLSWTCETGPIHLKHSSILRDAQVLFVQECRYCICRRIRHELATDARRRHQQLLAELEKVIA